MQKRNWPSLASNTQREVFLVSWPLWKTKSSLHIVDEDINLRSNRESSRTDSVSVAHRETDQLVTIAGTPTREVPTMSCANKCDTIQSCVKVETTKECLTGARQRCHIV